jgi:hypothetical protein
MAQKSKKNRQRDVMWKKFEERAKLYLHKKRGFIFKSESEEPEDVKELEQVLKYKVRDYSLDRIIDSKGLRHEH